jgi:hypothetical protein
VVEVALYFSSEQKGLAHYDLKFFDRCTGQTTPIQGPSDVDMSKVRAAGLIVAIPGPASGKFPVTIPAGVKSGALVAVASKPAIAASAPLLLGADTCA